jgi:hypothetical protein
MNKQLASTFKYLIMLGIGVLLMWLTFKNVDVAQTFEKIKNAHWFWVWMCILCGVVAYISRAYRWNMLIAPTGFKPKITNTFYAVCVAYFANLAVPRMGEVTRCGTLGKKEKIPFDILFGTVIVERVIDTLTLLIVIVILLFLEFETMWAFLSENVLDKFNLTLNAFTIIIVIVLIAAGLLAVRWFFKTENPVIKKVKLFITGIVDGLKSIRHIENTGLFIFHSVFIWIMYLLMVYIGFKAMDITSQLGLKAAIFTLVAGGLGMTAPVQGGIGAYHLLVSKGLLLFGIAYDDGLAFATLMHTSQMAQMVIMGLIALVVLFLTPDRDSKIN